jgi:hypothetical protein
MFNRKLSKKLDTIIIKLNAHDFQLVNIANDIIDIREAIDELDIEAIKDNLKKVNEMTLELKGVVSMARASVAKRKKSDAKENQSWPVKIEYSK